MKNQETQANKTSPYFVQLRESNKEILTEELLAYILEEENAGYCIIPGSMYDSVAIDLRSSKIGFIPIFGQFRRNGEKVFENALMIFPRNHEKYHYKKEYPFEKLVESAVELGQKYAAPFIFVQPPDGEPVYRVIKSPTDGTDILSMGGIPDGRVGLNTLLRNYFTLLKKVKKNTQDGPGDEKCDSDECESALTIEPFASWLTGYMRWLQGIISKSYNGWKEACRQKQKND